jgi:hypothetical protein
MPFLLAPLIIAGLPDIVMTDGNDRGDALVAATIDAQ